MAAGRDDELGDLEERIVQVHQVLAPAQLVVDHAALVAADDRRPRLDGGRVVSEQDPRPDHERVGDRHERHQRRAGLSALDLAEQAGADLGGRGDRAQREAAFEPQRPDASAQRRR